MPTQGSQTVLTGPVTPVSTAATIALSRRRSNPALKQLTQLNTPHQPITPKHLQSTPPMFPTVPSHIAMTALNDTLRMPLPLSPNVGPQTVNMDKAARTSQPMDDSGYFGSSGQVAGRSGAGGLFELLPSGHVHLAEQLIDSFTEKGSTAVDRRRVVDLLANLFARSDQAYGLNGPLCPGERQFSFGLPAIPDNGEYQSMSSPIPASVIQTSVMKMSVPDIRVLALQRQDSVMSMHPHAAVMPTRTDRAEMSVEAFDGTFTLNQYVMLQSIGHGAQGEVFLSVDLDKNEMRAIKAIPRPGGGGKLASDARSPLELARANRAAQHEREIEVMKRCRHRNIVSLYEVIDDPSSDKLYLVMQYIEHGSLVTLLPDGTASQVVKPELLAQYTRQLCAGLQYLHSHGVVHRDIKPDNILLGAGDTVYLSDFGVADVFDAHTHSSPIKGTRGTSAFLAPELVAAASAFDDPVVDGRAVDIWALGVTLYVMLFGRLPWDRTAKAVEFWRLVTEAEIHYPTIDPQNTVADDAWKALLRAMLQKKPQKRCTAEKARRLAKAVLQAYHDGGELVATDTLLPLVWESGKGPRPSVSDGSSDCMAFSGRTEEVSTTTNAASMRTDASS